MHDPSPTSTKSPTHGTVHASAHGADAAHWDVARGKAQDRATDWSLTRLIAVAWPYALVIAVGLFVLLPTLGEFGFWDPWEPKYAESAREMKERGSYVVPYYRGEVRLTKPILVYWGILAGALVFGLNEFGARIAGVSFAVAAACLLYYAISTLRGRTAGLFAALVLATSPHFYFISRQAMPDVYLFTTIGCSLLLFALGLYGPAPRRNVHFGLAYAALSLAVLAKGPLVAGAIFFTTVAVHAIAVTDLSVLTQKAVRARFGGLVVASAVGFALFVVGGLTAYVFGTSSLWWGYAAPQRLVVDEARRDLLGTMNRAHGQAILLSLLAAGFAIAAGLAWRRSTGGRGRTMPILATVMAISAIAGLALDPERQMLAVGILVAIVGATLVVGACSRFLGLPAIRQATEPWRAPIARQVLLFAIVTLVVAGPWHVAILIEQQHGYVTDFLVKHNINRVVEDVNSTGRSDFYLRTIMWAYFPWSALIPAMLAGLVAWTDRQVFRRQGFESYLLASALVIFVVFSSSVTKFNHYLAPMLLPMAALIGITLSRLIDRSVAWTRLAWLTGSMLFALIAMDLLRPGGVSYLVNTFTVKRLVPDELEPQSYVTMLVIAFGALLVANVFLSSKWVVAAMLATSVLFAHHYSNSFIPELSRHKSLKGLVSSYERYRSPNDPIGFNGDLKHGVFYYTDSRVELLPDNTALLTFMAPDKHAFLIIERANYLRIREPYKRKYPGQDLYLIDDSHFDYHLVANFSIPGAGPPPRPDRQVIVGTETD